MLAARLRKVLGPDALATPEARGTVTLREQDVMDVVMAEVPSSATAVNLQKIGELSGIENGRWKQRCDYMFVLDANGNNEVIFVELKKSLDAGRKEKAMEQLRRSPPVLMYLKSLCELEHEGEVKARLPRFRYFVIGAKNSEKLDKQRVRPVLEAETETFKKIQVGVLVGDRLPFGALSPGQ